MIHFKLAPLDLIEPFGTPPEFSLHWFGLTDGEIWLSLGTENIFEYSDAALEYWGDGLTRYNNYYLARFLEDFTELFPKIAVSLPEELYELTADLVSFRDHAQQWLDLNFDDDEQSGEQFSDVQEKLFAWTYQRTLDSGHLVGGPNLSFFRCGQRIRIIWETEQKLPNGLAIWTAKSGAVELDYMDFVRQVGAFGASFFHAMDIQIDLALVKDWEDIRLDKNSLETERQKRKDEFKRAYSSLNEKNPPTDWNEIVELCRKIQPTNE